MMAKFIEWYLYKVNETPSGSFYLFGALFLLGLSFAIWAFLIALSGGLLLIPSVVLPVWFIYKKFKEETKDESP